MGSGFGATGLELNVNAVSESFDDLMCHFSTEYKAVAELLSRASYQISIEFQLSLTIR